MTFLHKKSQLKHSQLKSSKLPLQHNSHITEIQFSKQFELSFNDQFLIKGPLGQVSIFLGQAYIAHDNIQKTLHLHTHLITPQNLALIKRLNKGLTIGYFLRIYQSGVWTILKKLIPNKYFAFQLGHCHPTYFHIPNHLLFKSKRDGQFRIINLFSLSYQLLKDTAAQLVRLQPADIYKLNGFRYANSKNMAVTQKDSLIGVKTKIGKKK